MTQPSDIEWTNATCRTVESGKGQALHSNIAKTLSILAQEQASKPDRRLTQPKFHRFGAG